MVDTEKCFKQKLYGSNENIKTYLTLGDIVKVTLDDIDFLKWNIIFFIPESEYLIPRAFPNL